MDEVHCINGRWQAGQGDSLVSNNPVTDHTVWSGKTADAAQVDLAVQGAKAAFKHWKRTPLADRLTVIYRFRDQLQTHQDRLAELIGQETGKPMWESKTEVAAMIGKVDLSVAAYHERTGENLTPTETGQRVLRHRPHGVMAVFGPYNFPGHLPNGHIVPALIAGNTVVFKPSEQAPATSEMTLRLWHAAGLPDGALNLVQGARATGEALAQHPAVNGILFTGSPQTGMAIQAAVRTQPQKILALEMGGNNPLIIGRDVDPDAALWATLQSAFASAGQRCTCARRLLVPKGEAGDSWLQRLVSAAADLKVGHFSDTDPEPFMGAVINNSTADRLLQAQQDLLALGGKDLLTMGAMPRAKTLLRPGIIDVTDITPPDEEYFGPLLTVHRYDTFEQAMHKANDTRFGLSAGLLSHDPAEYDIFINEIRAGIVNWNQPITGASSTMPFGGPGLSGNYRPSAWYAADYCAYPMASLEQTTLVLPKTLPPGMHL